MNKLILLAMVFGSKSVLAFDLGDYATTFYATKEAHYKAEEYLYLAEKDMIDFVSGHQSVLPFNVVDLHKLGAATQERQCGYQEACAKARSPSTVISKITELVNDPAVRAYFGSRDPNDSWSSEMADERLRRLDELVVKTQEYYDNLNPQRIEDQEVLFQVPKVIKVWNETIAGEAQSNGLPDPFSPNSYEVFREYREKRDTYFQALNQSRLSTGPFRAAQAAWAAGVQAYINNPSCTGSMGLSTYDEWIDQGAPIEPPKPVDEKNSES